MIDLKQLPRLRRAPAYKQRSSQNRIDAQRGFTLIELMVAMALGIFLIGGLLLTYGAGRSASLQAENLSRVQENVRFASDFIIRDARNAGFRDHLVLTGDQFDEIEENFASIETDENGNQALIVRYAGQGSCGRVFQASLIPRLIENRYFSKNGNLFCSGTEKLVQIDYDADGNSVITKTEQGPDEIQLAAGLAENGVALQFTFRNAMGVNDETLNECDFTDAGLESACTGVTATITFQDDPPRQVQLVAAFRNVILDRVYGR